MSDLDFAWLCEDDCCVHTLGDPARDGGCLVCDECDGDEGHDGSHDCGHGAAA